MTPRWRDVRARLRGMRRAKRPSLMTVAGNVYQTLLYTVIIGGVFVQVLRSVLGDLLVPPGTGTQYWLGAATALLGLALVLRVLPALGPVTVGPAAASWLLAAPIDRGAFLASRYLLVVAGGAVAGAAVGGAALLVGLTADLPGAVGLVVSAAAVGVLLAVLAVWAQVRRGRERVLVRTAGALTVPAVAGIAVVVLLERAGSAPQAPPGGAATEALVGVAVVALVPAVVAAVLGRLRLRGLDRTAVTAAGPLIAALTLSVGFMDGSITTGVSRERRLQAIGTVRWARRLRGSRRRALVLADLRRMARARSALATAVALLVVPYLASVVVPPRVVPIAQLLGATLAAGGLADGLRAVAASRGLRRSLGGTNPDLLALHGVGPAAVAVLWTLLVAPAGGSVLSLVLVPVSALAVVVRFATRPPRTYGGSMVDTGVGLGPLPVGMLVELSRGPLLFVVLAGVQLLAG
ncbi:MULTISPECIES: DUF6297 family protein [unclassified Pseudonocardia]|uniref:DUF6297 family protein n=1 Tax=unclassified Pseudonocardia TaxID=2619320 RepID=UPI000964D609|nr:MULTISPECIES: DUF6297 family protein [unclassified Pseudonocardia]MBN9096872.1 hypothetical protein [Pseudonocardia sp.]OJY37577.1 MAG: hypothetical protein BGP03_19415 [Pseudonocardia sp. 73-21]